MRALNFYPSKDIASFLHACCSGVYESKESAESAALSLANEIASKSPVAVQGSKVNLNYSRDHPVDDALDYAVSECYYNNII